MPHRRGGIVIRGGANGCGEVTEQRLVDRVGGWPVEREDPDAALVVLVPDGRQSAAA